MKYSKTIILTDELENALQELKSVLRWSQQTIFREALEIGFAEINRKLAEKNLPRYISGEKS